MLKYLLILLATLSLTSCTTPPTPPINQATNQQTSQVLYVDVREPDEWAAGHIEGAIHVPLGQIEAGTYDQISKDIPVKLYCQSGRRSGIALDILKKA